MSENIKTEISEWHYDLNIHPARREFIVGDVHGRMDLLRALLPILQDYASYKDAGLTFLGDLINRGPDSLGCLGIALSNVANFVETRLIIGNHEMSVLMVMAGKYALRPTEIPSLINEVIAAQNPEKDTFENSLASALSNRMKTIDIDLECGSGREMVDRFIDSQAIALNGNIALVHAGIDPKLKLRSIMKQMSVKKMIKECKMGPLLIQDEFLNYRDPMESNLIAIHGHTPERGKHGKGSLDDHFLKNHRLGLDGGKDAVVAAEIGRHGYRIFRASTIF